MEQEKRVSLNADVMLRRALDLRAKNNVLIAEFMGMKLGEDHTNDNMYYDDAENLHPPTPINELKFNSSWDWLMPVVEKIENFIFDENNSYNVTIGSTNYCVIQDSNGDTIEIIKDNGNSKLDTTYQAVVEFINQLNK